MPSERQKMETIARSLRDFLDAGLSYATNDLDKLYLLTVMIKHIDAKQKELAGEELCLKQEMETLPHFKDKKRVKKGIQKNSNPGANN